MTDQTMVQEDTLKDLEAVVVVKNLSPEDTKKVEEIKKTLNTDNSQTITQFGLGVQNDIASFSDSVLAGIRTKDTGEVGDVLTKMVKNVQSVNVDNLDITSTQGAIGLLAKIPLIGGLFDELGNFISGYESVKGKLDDIVNELNAERVKLIKDSATLGILYDKNKEYYKRLVLTIAAGESVLAELREKAKDMETKLPTAEDKDVAGEELMKMKSYIEKLEKKVYDLKISKTISIQTAPQIRLIQDNNEMLVDRIQNSIVTTIPIWKQQITIAITLFNQRQGVEKQKAVTETTNQLLIKNSELLKQNSIAIAQENQKGVVEVETLKQVNSNLISTLEETIRISDEGRTRRQQAETELVDIESTLKNTLLRIGK